MSEEEKKAIEHFNDLNLLAAHTNLILNYTESEIDYSNVLLKLVKKQQKENEQLRTVLNTLKDELIGDRMEQFDDYVIYLQTKYLKILGEEDD